MALQTENQFGGSVPDIGVALGGFQEGRKVRGQFEAGKAAKAKAGQDQQLQQMQFINNAAKNLRGLPVGERPAALDRLRSRFEDLGIPASELQGFDPSDTNLDSILASTGAFGEQVSALDQARTAQIQAPKAVDKEKPFTLSPGQQRFGPTGDVIAKVDPAAKDVTEVKVAPVLPASITANLSPELKQQAEDTFAAVGGGDKGIKAVTNIIDKGTEAERRAASPELLKTTFTRASEAELAQLQGVMDTAKNTESGMKAASKLREEQRRDKKVQVFQKRAIDLLEGIVNNDELGDVLGSIEGGIDFRFQDSESELIADIEEAGNILTADNLKLMSGVLSETDIKILANLAGGALNRKRSPERFIKDVTALIEKIKSQQVFTVDDRATDNQVQEGQFITNPTTGQRMQLVNGQFVEVQ